MTVSITIGSYKLPEFVDLNLAQCQKLFGDDIYLLVSDDRSPRSGEIKAVADRHGASYVVGEKRCSHFTGDLNTFLRAARFGTLTEADICLKISQRFIPAHQEFVSVLMEPFTDPEVSLVLPGQPQKRQMARPGAIFYAGFGLLTDVVAWRPRDLTAAQIEEFYRKQMADVNDTQKGKHLVEVTFGRIAATILKGRVRILDALANHQIGHPKIFLRKAMSNRGEYINLAREHGIEGDFTVEEWARIEGKDYVAMSAVI